MSIANGGSDPIVSNRRYYRRQNNDQTIEDEGLEPVDRSPPYRLKEEIGSPLSTGVANGGYRVSDRTLWTAFMMHS